MACVDHVQGETAVKTTLDMINRMQAAGVIGKYALGDAIGAILYVEAFYREDLGPAHCSWKLSHELFAYP
jgi:hypothetical protein